MERVGDIQMSHNVSLMAVIDFSVMYHKCLTAPYIGDLKKTHHLSGTIHEKDELGIRIHRACETA